MKVFESLVKLRETKEIELHKMIELEPWLINDSFTLSFSNRTFQSILEKKLKPADYEEYGKMRPDLAGIEGEDTFSLIELKRPKLKVSEDELNQLEKYLVVLRKHLTQYDQIVGYLIGDETSENFTRHLNHRKNIHFISYWDLIASVKKRCKAFLESN